MLSISGILPRTMVREERPAAVGASSGIHVHKEKRHEKRERKNHLQKCCMMIY